MPARLLEGKPVAEAILGQAADRAAALKARGIEPGLALVRVGEDPASVVYLRKKREACASVGIRSVDVVLPAGVPPGELLKVVRDFNGDRSVHGILVQFPLPAGLKPDEVIAAIDPDKDVDGFHPLNAGRLASGLPGFIPCTPLGIMLLLRHYGIDLEERLVAVLGRSNIVGRPVAQLFSQKRSGLNATVLMAHSRTADLPRLTGQADVIVAAIGRARMVQREWVKPGAVVIDVGMNRVPDPTSKSGSRLVGDVDFGPVSQVAGAITPVPGGVGLLTVACLCLNTVAAAAGEGSPW